jgi:SAM-dependent methyltransferase
LIRALRVRSRLSDDALFWVRSSFCGGDFSNWERVRRFIALEVPSWARAVLDVGCASGLLLRSLRDWSGVPFAPFGFDVHWVVGLAPHLFAPDCAGGAFARCSMEAFLASGGAQLGAPQQRYDLIFWNVWCAYDLDAAGCAAVQALLGLLAPRGKLVLGLCASDAARNLARIHDLQGALGAQASPLGASLRVVENKGIPHCLVVLQVP